VVLKENGKVFSTVTAKISDDGGMVRTGKNAEGKSESEETFEKQSRPGGGRWWLMVSFAKSLCPTLRELRFRKRNPGTESADYPAEEMSERLDTE
jgi:hypothetical protein